MRRFRASMLSIACLGLLAVQLSGLHMHLDAHGYTGVPVGTHVHRTDGHHHDHSAAHGGETDRDGHHGDSDHDGDRDVSVVQLGVAVAKLVLFFVWIAFCFVVTPELGSRLRFSFVSTVPRGRQARWRPPLRAPPAFSH